MLLNIGEERYRDAGALYPLQTTEDRRRRRHRERRIASHGLALWILALLLVLAERPRQCLGFAPLLLGRNHQQSFATSHRRPPPSATKVKRSEIEDIDDRPRKSYPRKSRSPLHIEREILNHELLSKQEEVELAKQYQQARQLGEKMHGIIEDKIEALQYGSDDDDEYYEDTFADAFEYPDSPAYATTAEFPFHIVSEHTLEQHHRRSLVDEMNFSGDDDFSSEGRNNIIVTKNSNPEGDASSLSSISAAMDILSDDDIEPTLGMSKHTAYRTLQRGAQARDRLIRSNLKLVSSIAHKWSSQYTDNRSDGTQYEMTWNRPGLSETLQEGTIGLATAVERFNPKRGMRLSTYATFWITNSIRRCYQYASTPLMKLPTGVYETKTRYMRLVQDFVQLEGKSPSYEVIAEHMNITTTRLRSALDMTNPIVQLDHSTSEFKEGIVAGIIDPMEDPEAQLEVSFLRQSLESAMAAYLSPHERDVLRLRLGLDDGVSKTFRQISSDMGDAVSDSQVRRTEQRALKKLRSPVALATYKLLAFANHEEREAMEAAARSD